MFCDLVSSFTIMCLKYLHNSPPPTSDIYSHNNNIDEALHLFSYTLAISLIKYITSEQWDGKSFNNRLLTI